MQHAEYKIVLPTFEGPFDLLFHLIKKAEVDIWSVSIAAITEQYLAYLRSMQELNLDIASEFLVMAATLLRLKSKLLLPRLPHHGAVEEEEELFEINTAEELFQRLEEYRLYKEAARLLKEKESEQKKVFLRSTGGRKMMVFTRQETVYTIWEGAQHLSDIMQRFAEIATTGGYVPSFSVVEDFIINRKSTYIQELLEKKGRPLPFNVFVNEKGLWGIIVTFVALLEMSRQKKVNLLQERPFATILVSLREVNGKEEQGGERTAETGY